MNIKKLLTTSLLAATVLTACSPSAPSEGSTGNSNTNDAIKIEHSLGTTELQKTPVKTVVFDYGLVDILDGLGVEITALPKTQLPAALEKFKADSYSNAGSLQEPDFEQLAELAPDVILISGRAEAHYAELTKLAPTVFFTTNGPDYMAGMAENAEILGKIYGKESEAEVKISKLNEMADGIKVKAEASGKNALILMANDGALSAYGPGSRFGLIHSLGFTPADTGIEDSTHGQNVTFEYVLEQDPDHIFVIDRSAIAGGENSAEKMFDNELIRQTRAFQADNIHYLDAYNWYVISGGFTSTENMLTELEAAVE